jgi:phosphomannomutase
MNKSIFKAYDIRGLYPQDINKDVVKKIGRACAELFEEGEIIIGHDIRHGSTELTKVLEESLIESAKEFNKKISVLVIGLTTTPMFYFLVNYCKSSGGCMITASHNPKEYNGIKIVRENAEMVAGTDILQMIEA